MWVFQGRINGRMHIGTENTGKCCQGSPRPSLVLFTRQIHKTLHSCFHGCDLHGKRIQYMNSKAKGSVGESQRKPGTSMFQESSPRQVTQDAHNSSSQELWQHRWNVVCQRSSLETHHSGLYRRVGHISYSPTWHIKCQTPRRKVCSDAQQEAYVCTNHLGTVNHTYQGMM